MQQILTGHICCERSYIRLYADRILGTLGVISIRVKGNLIFCCSYKKVALGKLVNHSDLGYSPV